MEKRNPPTSSEILALLQRCSYKVSVVKSARQVVKALKLKGADVDILLTDVELPLEKGFKMLKHITRQDNLSHISIVVMSEQDDMSVIAKCLLLGAVDYLVKPLRLNEVINLWTHMWRRRRSLELPDRQDVVENINICSSLSKPDTTIDFLSIKEKGGATLALDTGPSKNQTDWEAPQLELSLRLSLSFDAEEPNNEASVPSHDPPAKEKIGNESAFSWYSKAKKHKQEPDEQSGNMCSSRRPLSKRARLSNDECLGDNRELACEHHAMADASSDSPIKEISMADENRLGDMESQICDVEPHQLLVPCHPMEERIHSVKDLADVRIHHLQQAPSSFTHTHEPRHGLMESRSTDLSQGFAEGVSPTENHMKPMQHFSQAALLHPPPLWCEAGMANLHQSMYSYYPVTHLAVPVMGFSTWQPIVPSPHMVGTKATQSEMREAALSKFRMKRKGRCFEKKIRYASRKKVAEQRPRIRGQFVKRSALTGPLESPSHGSGCNEEGGAEDEQASSELDDNSLPGLI